MRWQLKEIDPLVKFHLAQGVDAQLLVWVHGHEEGADVCLEERTKAPVRHPGVQAATVKDCHGM